METKTEVTIFGEKLTLVSDESEDYIKELAAYVDGKMAEVFKYKKGYSTRPFIDSILIGMNIADDMFKRLRDANDKPAEKAEPVVFEKHVFLEKQVAELNANLRRERDGAASLKKRNERLAEDLAEKSKEIGKVQRLLDEKTREADETKKEFDMFLEAYDRAEANGL